MHTPAANHKTTWPDALTAPQPERIQQCLAAFWRELAALPELHTRGEQLLMAELTARLRGLLLEMMLALNGIGRPPATRHLNGYLGQSQRTAIEATLIAPAANGDAWLGQAVALLVIYRWYAPQLVEKYGLTYPQALETATWNQLCDLPDWPISVTTA
ncbi:MAG: hypothetical protein R3A44_20000 [Caldilineaceae bacterium]